MMLPPRIDLRRLLGLPFRVWLVAVLAWLAASACNDETINTDYLGGQTGDGTPMGDGGESGVLTMSGEACLDQESEPVASLDEELPELGFSAQQMLAWVADGIESTLLWAPDGGVQTQPESGTGSVEITFKYDGGKILLYPSVSADTQAEGLAVAPCPAFLAIEVQATLRTPGGAFDETFPVVLKSYVPEFVSFGGELDIDSLQGELEVEYDQEVDLSGFWVDGVVSPFGSTGTISSTVSAEQSVEGPVEMAAPSRLAVWPAPGDCVGDEYGGGALSVAVDADLGGYSASAAHEALSAFDQQPLVWDTGEATELSLEVVEPVPHCVWVDATTGTASLSFAVTVRASTSDERWDAEYDGAIDAYANADGGLGSLNLRVYLEGSAEQFDAAGLPGVSAEGYDSFSVSLFLRSDLSEESTSGDLTVLGTQGEACEPPAEVNSPQAEPLVRECPVVSDTLAQASIGEATTESEDPPVGLDESVEVELSQDE